jgi:hypothetical protein
MTATIGASGVGSQSTNAGVIRQNSGNFIQNFRIHFDGWDPHRTRYRPESEAFGREEVAGPLNVVHAANPVD